MIKVYKKIFTKEFDLESFKKIVSKNFSIFTSNNEIIENLNVKVESLIFDLTNHESSNVVNDDNDVVEEEVKQQGVNITILIPKKKNT